MQMQTQSLPRKHFTRQRKKLSSQTREQLARQASQKLIKLRIKLPKQAKIGIYYDGFGELPTQPILDWCLRLGYQVYLPIVGSLPNTDKRLRFAPINRYKLINLATYTHPLGMKQPQSRKLIWAYELDAVFCPLVAVDRLGTRMGMGGGYYDRTLARSYKFGRKTPLKIGWAYDFQVADKIRRQAWDVPMDVIITPNHFYRVASRQTQHTANEPYPPNTTSSAESVTLYLQKIETLKAMETHRANGNSDSSLEDAKFSEQELARLINPTGLQTLMNQADGFLNGLTGLIADYKVDDGQQ